MATVWKFQLELKDKIEIEMPRDAELLHVEIQNETPCLWARVVPERTLEVRRFRICGTGHEIDMNCRHIGSFMLQRERLVFHLFEVMSTGGTGGNGR